MQKYEAPEMEQVVLEAKEAIADDYSVDIEAGSMFSKLPTA